jgi:serralysin
MPTARATGSQPVDMRTLHLGDLLSGTITSRSADAFRITYANGDTDLFEGEFGYGPDGLPYGAIERVTAVRAGGEVFEAEGLEADAQIFLYQMLAQNPQGALAELFRGYDEIGGSPGADWLNGYDMPDRINGGAGDDTLFGGGGRDEMDGGPGADSISGGESGDRIFGGDGVDFMNGNQGGDYVHGGAGDDWLFGGQDTDQVVGGDGNDFMNGNLGSDTLDGGDGADTIYGGQSDDVLYGYDGADWMSGDRGDDMLTGGKGGDVFYFATGFGVDIVRDFDATSGDRVMLQPGTSYLIHFDDGDAIINLGNGDMLVLLNVGPAQLENWLV